MVDSFPSSANLALATDWTEKGLYQSESTMRQSRTGRDNISIPVNFFIHQQKLLGCILGASLHQVNHVVVAKILDGKRWQMALFANVIHNLAYPPVVGLLRPGAGGLFHFKVEVVNPEIATVEVPTGVLLVHLACLVNASLDLPQQPCPLSRERTLGVDVTLVAL